MTSVPCDWREQDIRVMQSCNMRGNICLFKSDWCTIGKLIIWWGWCDTTADSLGSRSHELIPWLYFLRWHHYIQWRKNNLLSLLIMSKLFVHSSVFFFFSLNETWCKSRQTKCLSMTSSFHHSLIRQARCQTLEWTAKEWRLLNFISPTKPSDLWHYQLV